MNARGNLPEDKVTSVLRAPFTQYQKPGAPGEVEEEPLGTGPPLLPLANGPPPGSPLDSSGRRAFQRMVESIFASLTPADFLQMANKATEERA